MQHSDPTEVPAPPGGAIDLHVAMVETLGNLVDSVAAIDRMQASLAAQKAELIAHAAKWSQLTESAADDRPAKVGGWDAETVAHRQLVSELACALRIPERTAETLVQESAILVDELPATLTALAEGKITYRHAKVIIDNTMSMPPESREGFEEAILPTAETVTVARLERTARTRRERLHPDSIDIRTEDAAAKRFVEVQPGRDGMVWLTAHLPAADGLGAFNRLTDIALQLNTAEEARTLAQLRADVFVKLLHDGVIPSGEHQSVNGIRPTVLITVPVLSLLGQGDETASLEGYGPISIAVATQLAAEAPSFVRILTHPETGTVLSVGRDRYAVPKDLRMYLRKRDGTCRFPGCNRSVRRSDLDHTEDWAHGGQTAHDNLAHLCPRHHEQKHRTGWRVKQLSGGVLEWTSPTGRTYTTYPETVIGS